MAEYRITPEKDQTIQKQATFFPLLADFFETVYLFREKKSG